MAEQVFNEERRGSDRHVPQGHTPSSSPGSDDGKDSGQKLTDLCIRGISFAVLAGVPGAIARKFSVSQK
jgi:hypothetical protein